MELGGGGSPVFNVHLLRLSLVLGLAQESGEPEGGETPGAGRAAGLAAAPGVAHVGQRLQEPGGGTLGGAGGARAQLPPPGLHTLVLDSENRADPAGAEGMKGPEGELAGP